MKYHNKINEILIIKILIIIFISEVYNKYIF